MAPFTRFKVGVVGRAPVRRKGNQAIMHRDGESLVIEPVRKRGLIAPLECHRSRKARMTWSRSGFTKYDRTERS